MNLLNLNPFRANAEQVVSKNWMDLVQPTSTEIQYDFVYEDESLRDVEGFLTTLEFSLSF